MSKGTRASGGEPSARSATSVSGRDQGQGAEKNLLDGIGDDGEGSPVVGRSGPVPNGTWS
jgi:hypothetical protein